MLETMTIPEFSALLAALVSADRDERLAAIKTLEQHGDAAALAALRERMHLVGQEHQALILAVAILRWRLAQEDETAEPLRLHDN